MQIKYFLKLLPLLLYSALIHANNDQIPPETLLNLLQANQTPIILDVRSHQEYQTGHITKAVNIPYDQLTMNADWLHDNQHKEVIIYCRSGRRAQRAYQILQSKGFTQLVMLKGHMNLWQQSQYPLVKGD